MTMCNCVCDQCGDGDDRVQTVESWSDLHSGLNTMWHALELDLRRTCSRWVIEDVRREWFRKRLGELSPETCRALDRAAEELN